MSNIKLREDQKCPPITSDGWSTMLWIYGRGGGKKVAGAKAVVDYALSHPNCKIALVAPITGMGVNGMIEGTGGILEWTRQVDSLFSYGTVGNNITWSNGSTASIYCDATAKTIRGQSFDLVWVDEIDHFQHTNDENDAFHMSKFALEAGGSPNPKLLITGTPSKDVKGILRSYYLESLNPSSSVIYSSAPSCVNSELPDSYIRHNIDETRANGTYHQQFLGLLPEVI